MNICVHVGRAVSEPKVNYTQGGMCVAKFALAVDRMGRNKGADFPLFVAFGKTGEFAEKYVKKGGKYIITSHVQTGSYTNKEGNKVFTTEFAIDNIEFAESKAAQEQNTQASQPQTTQPQNDVPTVRTYDDFMHNIPDTIDESVPFM